MLLIVLVGIVLAVAAGLWGKSRFLRDEDVDMRPEVLETETELHPEDIYHLQEVKPLTEEQLKDQYTLLVIGGEAPAEGEEGAREDAQAIILMNINHARDCVCFCSMHTGLYAEIPELGGYRLGSAYAVGGGPLLAETLEKNYGIHIDNYASISFREVARVMEMPEFETMDISRDGVDVLEKLVYEKLGSLGGAEVVSYITSLLPYVTHNIESGQMMKLMMQVPRVVGYYSEKASLPLEGLYRELDGYLVPQIGETAAWLQEWMYAEQESGESNTEVE